MAIQDPCVLRRPSYSFGPVKNGAILAAFAEQAYDPRRIECDHTWDAIEPFEHGNARGVLAFAQPADSPPIIVIAIAGTNDFLDAMQDLNARVTTLADSKLKVHVGFANHALAVRTALRPWRGLLSKPGAKIWLVGHSLGGAVATLLPLLMTLPTATRIVTYGAPPAILQGYGSRYAETVTRYADMVDWVPKAYRTVYENVGRPFFVRASKRVTGSPSIFHWLFAWANKLLKISYKGFFRANKHFHSMTRYRKILDRHYKILEAAK